MNCEGIRCAVAIGSAEKYMNPGRIRRFAELSPAVFRTCSSGKNLTGPVHEREDTS